MNKKMRIITVAIAIILIVVGCQSKSNEINNDINLNNEISDNDVSADVEETEDVVSSGINEFMLNSESDTTETIEIVNVVMIKGDVKPQKSNVVEMPMTDDDLNIDFSKGLDDNGFYEGINALDIVEMIDVNAIVVPRSVHLITEKEVENEINNLLNYNPTLEENVTDQVIANGDTVNFDFVCMVEGVEYINIEPGILSDKVTIEEPNYFFDGFLKQLIGHMPGEVIDVRVTLTENNPIVELRGKEAVFKTTVNYILPPNTPKLTDEFVKKNFTGEYKADSAEELKAFLREKIQYEVVWFYMYNHLFANMSVSSLPEEVILYQQMKQVNNISEKAYSEEMTVDEYLSSKLGYESLDSFLDFINDNILDRSKISLYAQAIAEKEDVVVTDEDLESYFVSLNQLLKKDELIEHYGIGHIKNNILVKVVIEYLMNIAIFE